MTGTPYLHVKHLLSDLVQESGAQAQDQVFVEPDRIEMRLEGTSDFTMLRLRMIVGFFAGAQGLLEGRNGAWDYEQFYAALTALELAPKEHDAIPTGRVLPRHVGMDIGNLHLAVQESHIALVIRHRLPPEKLIEALDPLHDPGSVQAEGKTGNTNFSEFVTFTRPSYRGRGN